MNNEENNKICFLIQTHKNKNQLVKLINRLKKDFDIFVNIDKRSRLNINETKNSLKDNSENVHIYKFMKIEHGGVSQVVSALFLLKESKKNNYDRYVFISGQCVPVKSNNEIKNIFNKYSDKEFISYKDVNSDSGLKSDIARRMNNYNFGKIYRLILSEAIRKSISNLPFIKRQIPDNLYFGDQWFNITKSAAEYILSFIKENTDFLKRFNYTWGGDEVFFQTILLNSSFKNRCINDALRYIVWRNGVPKTFTLDDYEDIKKYTEKSNVIFARKFDENIDNAIIDMLYKDTESNLEK